MTAKPIIIDCDPGQDDAVALFLALSSPDDLNVLGITAVAGNVPLELTQRNARQMCDIANRPDVPVYAGCAEPMIRELTTAEHVHGGTGINGIDVVEPSHPLDSRHAVDFIIETLDLAEDNSITLVPMGPLTNIGQVLSRKPSIVGKIREIVLMGGALREAGNITPSAEFNIYVDPQAAQVVLNCGRPVTVFSLDVTHQVITTPDRCDEIRAIGNNVSDATAGMLDFYGQHDERKYRMGGAPLHDPCTIAYLLQPELFEGKTCNVSIEIDSELSMGSTVVDFWHITEKPRNANWIHTADADGFYALLVERLARFPSNG